MLAILIEERNMIPALIRGIESNNASLKRLEAKNISEYYHGKKAF